MQQYIPQTLATATLTHPDKIACLTNHIYTAPALRRAFEEGQLVPLTKTELRKNYGQWNLDNAIKEALSKDIIYQDRSYKCGKSSKGYCIGYTYKDDPIGTYALADKKLIKRISSYTAKKREEERQTWSDIHKLLNNDLRQIIIDKIDEGEIWEMAGHEITKFNPYVISYNMIRDKDWKFKVCKNGRVHTNYTNLNKHFRRHISIHGERLVKVDVKNCQPLLLTLMLTKFYSYKGYREDTDHQSTIQTITEYHYPYVGRFLDLEGRISRYQKLCESGKFYDNIASDLGWKRKQAKKQLITYLFDKVKPTIISHYMQQHFPIIHEMMVETKSFDYRCVANELQQQESSMMIQGCAFNFKRKYPNVPLVTIHDCLCVPESFGYDKLEQVIYDSFGQYSLTPTLEKE